MSPAEMRSAPTFYHNPRCSKSREALRLLEGRGVTPTIILYLVTPLSREQLRTLIGKLQRSPRDCLRTREDIYKTLNLAAPSVTDTEILDAMCAHPQLIERPILEWGERAVIGRPPEAVLALVPGGE